MKTGLFFGSFNPIHNGHMGIANYVLDFTEVDELWFVVSPQNPLKQVESLAPDFHRLEMVKRAIPDTENRMSVCDVEMEMPKPSYTIDTVRELEKRYPKKQFMIILGSDSLQSIQKWKSYNELLSEYQILIYPRIGIEIQDIAKQYLIKVINAPLFNFSATYIREQISLGKDTSNLVPDLVKEYIIDNGLYQTKPQD